MSEFYQEVFEEFKMRLEESADELFGYALPFTQINRLAMLAASTADDCRVAHEAKQEAAQQTGEADSALVVRDSSGVVTCKTCGTGLGYDDPPNSLP